MKKDYIRGDTNLELSRQAEELRIQMPTFQKFLAEKVDDKLRNFMDGSELAGKKRRDSNERKDRDNYVIPSAVRKQYVFSYIRSIYDGTLKGDAGFFRNQLLGYNEKVFKIKPDGSRSIADNIKNAEKALDKELWKLGKKDSEALGLKMAVLTKIYDMSGDTAQFFKLFDGDELHPDRKVTCEDRRAGKEKDQAWHLQGRRYEGTHQKVLQLI